jgi:hypothetical protein
VVPPEGLVTEQRRFIAAQTAVERHLMHHLPRLCEDDRVEEEKRQANDGRHLFPAENLNRL